MESPMVKLSMLPLQGAQFPSLSGELRFRWHVWQFSKKRGWLKFCSLRGKYVSDFVKFWDLFWIHQDRNVCMQVVRYGNLCVYTNVLAQNGVCRFSSCALSVWWWFWVYDMQGHLWMSLSFRVYMHTCDQM